MGCKKRLVTRPTTAPFLSMHAVAGKYDSHITTNTPERMSEHMHIHQVLKAVRKCKSNPMTDLWLTAVIGIVSSTGLAFGHLKGNGHRHVAECSTSTEYLSRHRLGWPAHSFASLRFASSRALLSSKLEEDPPNPASYKDGCT